MTILYYTWFENSENDIYETFIALGNSISKINIPLNNYNHDPEFIQHFQRILAADSYDCIFTFNFFPIISDLAASKQIPYICWIYDNPHYTLYSSSIRNQYNYIFSFDYFQYEQLKALGLPHIFHMPLAVNTNRLNAKLSNPSLQRNVYDVSFVGSLYETNVFRHTDQLPEYLNGYINGLLAAQKLIYGCNLIYDLLSADIITELNQYVPIELGDNYHTDRRIILGDLINAELTHRERVGLLTKLSEQFNLTIFTGSDRAWLPRAAYGGYVSYLNEMPEIFAASKININLTLRSIISGIPLRALDIMGAGGFLLSNYQPELAEYFTDGSELVLFDSEEELIDKVSYYLDHEEERKNIAARGYQRIQEAFSYRQQLNKILAAVFKNECPAAF